MNPAAKGKIALFACNDLTGWLIVNGLVPRIQAMGYEPVIFNTGDHRNRQFTIPSPAVVAFFNAALPRDVISPVLEGQPISHAANHTLRQLSFMHGIEYREIKNVNDPSFVAEIAADENMRGGIATRFLQVFEKEAISVFHEKGFLWNLHSGLLPQYKGLLTPYRAIANGEKSYGMTLHDLTCRIDEGDIVSTGRLLLDASKPVLDLYMDTVPLGVDMVIEALSQFDQQGYVPKTPQAQLGSPVYYPNPTAQEFARYTASGIFYADQQTSVERITSLFTVKGSIQEALLQRKLEETIANASGTPARSFPVAINQTGIRAHIA